MVPGSTFRYGSSFCMLTRSPRSLSSLPMLDAVSPLPRLDATPPVTKRCLVVAGRDVNSDGANDPPVVRSGGNPLAHGVSGYQQQSSWLGKHDVAIARGVPDLGRQR